MMKTQANHLAKIIRRYDRIMAVMERTKRENTARRCACRLSVIARLAREHSAAYVGEGCEFSYGNSAA